MISPIVLVLCAKSPDACSYCFHYENGSTVALHFIDVP